MDLLFTIVFQSKSNLACSRHSLREWEWHNVGPIQQKLGRNEKNSTSTYVHLKSVPNSCVQCQMLKHVVCSKQVTVMTVQVLIIGGLHAKKVVSDSPGLVDVGVRLVNSVLYFKLL